MSSPLPILILTGPPGTGKTTVAADLARRRERAVHLEADRFFHFIASGYVEPFLPESHEQNQAVMEIVGAAAAGYANAGYFTIVDGIVIPRWYLGTLREAIVAAGHEVAYAVLRAPRELCTGRVHEREGAPIPSAADLARLWSEFADLGEYERHALEVGDRSPTEAATELERLLADGRLTI